MSWFRAFALLGVALMAFAAVPTVQAAADDETGDPKALRHSADGNYWDFSPIGKLELPRLFLIRNASGNLDFDAFLTTHGALDSGKYTLAQKDGVELAEAEVTAAIASHEYIYYPVKPIGGEVIIDFSITRQLLFVFFTAILVVLIITNIAGRYAKGVGREEAPKGTWHNMMEVVIVFVRDEIAKPAIGDAKYEKYLPYLLTVFFFVALGNLLGLLPFGVTATSHIMVTAALALLTFIITQFAGTKDYWGHIFNPPGVPAFVKPILVPIEIIGMFTKPLALAFRLFGNMASGHLVIVSIIGIAFIFKASFGTAVGIGTALIVSVPLTIFIYLLKFAVCLIQAYIFTMLSAVFIGIAAEEHHGHEHDHHHADERDELQAPIEQLAAPA